ncbi:hypothetical protein [Actinoallomurus sp. NPDC050550]|uniref:hypothetical protein n=1 Tax=Actinoallomurus sp. NPDC050550 TaxID=3154937 RepID=UPI0033EBA8DB
MTLPAAPAHLVGRTDETNGLLELLDPRKGESEAVVVSAAVILGECPQRGQALILTASVRRPTS